MPDYNPRMFDLHVTEIARVVQLVITPAFLLAGPPLLTQKHHSATGQPAQS